MENNDFLVKGILSAIILIVWFFASEQGKTGVVVLSPAWFLILAIVLILVFFGESFYNKIVTNPQKILPPSIWVDRAKSELESIYGTNYLYGKRFKHYSFDAIPVGVLEVENKAGKSREIAFVDIRENAVSLLLSGLSDYADYAFITHKKSIQDIGKVFVQSGVVKEKSYVSDKPLFGTEENEEVIL